MRFYYRGNNLCIDVKKAIKVNKRRSLEVKGVIHDG